VALVEVGLLTEDVDHNHDRVEPAGLRKLNNEATETVSQRSSGISVG
jgi:hypothetical protein